MHHVQPKSGSWTGWSVQFLGYRARRNSLEWPFHSKELQRRHVPQKLFNPPRSELTKKVKGQVMQNAFIDNNAKLKNKRSTAGFRFGRFSIIKNCTAPRCDDLSQPLITPARQTCHQA